MRFTKMHGCGNDYVYLDAWQEQIPADLPALARAISHRHFGVGADGLVVVGPGEQAPARMTMFNADGSQAEMCGNALRCCARLAYAGGHLDGPQTTFETGAGLLPVTCLLDGAGHCTGASVDMGRPRLDPAAVPVNHPGPGPLLGLELAVDGYPPFAAVAVGMGNPHAVIFVDDVDSAPVCTAGPLLEHHPAFPNRTNVEFVSRLDVADGQILRQRTWERGSGETWACGTGACAAVVAAVLAGVVAPGATTVRLNGGDLDISWDGEGSIIMAGPATQVFTGDWPLDGAG
ncbi:MAG: diaminopimelate epimerase [Planctomycetota bacterium]